MILGYARTSTIAQLSGLEAQERDLLTAGAGRVVSEHASAAKSRPRLDACLAELRAGDVLIVTKPDRLARSTAHLLGIVDDLRAREIGLVILSMGGERLDSRTATSRLMLTMLGAAAEFEREIMLERQREGVAKAKAEGKFKGGKTRIDHGEMLRLAADLGPEATAREMKVSRASVYRALATASRTAAVKKINDMENI